MRERITLNSEAQAIRRRKPAGGVACTIYFLSGFGTPRMHSEKKNLCVTDTGHVWTSRPLTFLNWLSDYTMLKLVPIQLHEGRVEGLPCHEIRRLVQKIRTTCDEVDCPMPGVDRCPDGSRQEQQSQQKHKAYMSILIARDYPWRCSTLPSLRLWERCGAAPHFSCSLLAVFAFEPCPFD